MKAVVANRRHPDGVQWVVRTAEDDGEIGTRVQLAQAFADLLVEMGARTVTVEWMESPLVSIAPDLEGPKL